MGDVTITDAKGRVTRMTEEEFRASRKVKPKSEPSGFKSFHPHDPAAYFPRCNGIDGRFDRGQTQGGLTRY